MDTKICKSCKKEKTLDKFGKKPYTDQPLPRCYECYAEEAKQRYWERLASPEAREHRSSVVRARKEKYAAQGLCADCGEKTEGIAKQCPRHLYLHAQRERKRRGLTRSERICTHCGKNQVGYRRRMCDECSSPSGPRMRKYQINWHHQAVRATYAKYGGEICVCCGETNWKFLTLDHINNDGNTHRKEISKDGTGLGVVLYRWLRKHNYPPGFQILCFNCNCGKNRNGGKCPHQDQK